MTNYRYFYKRQAGSNMENELEGMRLETVKQGPRPLELGGTWCGFSYPRGRTDRTLVTVRWECEDGGRKIDT